MREEPVLFYEREYYVLSNFSAFRLRWFGLDFDTSEHAYQWMKFPNHPAVQQKILTSRSAHDAFKYAEQMVAFRRDDWHAKRVDAMREIIKAKFQQHEYVQRKLLQTRDRILIEDSWRDSFWGWGQDKLGENMLGKLWMELRHEVKQEQGEMHPATVIVHWPGKSTSACDKHAASLKALAAGMGLPALAVTPLTTPSQCANCINEARRR